jgi:hypothetical protein
VADPVVYKCYIIAITQEAAMELNTIYLVCAIAGGTVLVLRVILLLFGVDGGGDVEVEIDPGAAADAIDGSGNFFTFLSLQSIAGFFTMFGLVGMGLLQIEATNAQSLAGALAAGVFTAWATGMIFIALRKLQSDGTMVLERAIGKKGTVYLTIPEKGTGVVTVAVQGGLKSLDAVSEKGTRIPTGAIIEVVGVKAGSILIVAEEEAETKKELLEKPVE